jgi:hypothetical protein
MNTVSMHTAIDLDKKPGRPAGHKRQILGQWLRSHHQFTMGQLARGLGWSVRDANDTIRRAIARQELTVAAKVPQPGCKRKVALYARPCADAGPSLHAVMAVWVG